MKSARFAWLALLLLAPGCSSDDAPGDPPDAAALDAAALDAAPDAAPVVPCEDRYLPAVIDSVVMGSRPSSGNVDEVVTWQDGEEVQLVYGGQGSLMLVAEVVARGSGLTDELMSFHVRAAISTGGEDVHRNYYGNPVVAAADGTWRWESVFLPFEIDLPAEGDALDVTLAIGCFDIQRRIIAHLPPKESAAPAAADLDRER